VTHILVSVTPFYDRYRINSNENKNKQHDPQKYCWAGKS